jgi:hypothetical protein
MPRNAHQALDAFAVHFQLHGQLAAAVKRALQVQLIELAEQTQILRALRQRLVVVA